VRPLNCCKEKAEAAEALEPLAKGEAEEGADDEHDEQLAAGVSSLNNAFSRRQNAL
jgi:hypothetical protein